MCHSNWNTQKSRQNPPATKKTWGILPTHYLGLYPVPVCRIVLTAKISVQRLLFTISTQSQARSFYVIKQALSCLLLWDIALGLFCACWGKAGAALMPFHLVFMWPLLRNDGNCNIYLLQAVKSRMACPRCSVFKLHSTVADPLCEQTSQCDIWLLHHKHHVELVHKHLAFLEYCFYSADGTAKSTWSVRREDTAT